MDSMLNLDACQLLPQNIYHTINCSYSCFCTVYMDMPDDTSIANLITSLGFLSKAFSKSMKSK